MLMHETGFSRSHPDHFRLLTLPSTHDLTPVISRIERFLARHHP